MQIVTKSSRTSVGSKAPEPTLHIEKEAVGRKFSPLCRAEGPLCRREAPLCRAEGPLCRREAPLLRSGHARRVALVLLNITSSPIVRPNPNDVSHRQHTGHLAAVDDDQVAE